jgi:hypothetical protein
VRKPAEKESVSINQIITLAVAEKLSALMTEDYLPVTPAGQREGGHRAVEGVTILPTK